MYQEHKEVLRQFGNEQIWILAIRGGYTVKSRNGKPRITNSPLRYQYDEWMDAANDLFWEREQLGKG